MAGFLVVDKPVGLSSFKVVGRVRRSKNVKKVGHSGTLDPFASGVLVIGVGKEFTRQLDTIQALPKTYVATLTFGIETDTLDSFGTVTKVNTDIPVTESDVRSVLHKFTGELEQMPPAFSAKKIDGKRAYELARKGQEVQLKPSNVTVYGLEILWFKKGKFPSCCIEIKCSKGTYVRSLVRDIAKEMGTVAYTKDLIRTAVGPYRLEDATTFGAL
jgi:tRNA pseudouridine55 synthase